VVTSASSRLRTTPVESIQGEKTERAYEKTGHALLYILPELGIDRMVI
jgi:hypothetical protein